MATSEDSDESLMRMIRQGSYQAFSLLVRRHTDRFYAACYRMAGSRAEAEDMVQEAFLKIWKNPDIWKDDAGAKFTTWFYRILSNQNIDRMRRGKNMAGDNSVLEFLPDTKDSPEHMAAANEEQAAIEAALSALPERQKTALNLCFYEGLSNVDAANAMGVKVKALESLLMRAKAGLRDIMARNNDTLLKRKTYGTR